MNEDFGSDFITLTDESGNEFTLEMVSRFDFEDNTYMAFFPAEETAEGEEPTPVDEETSEELILLKVVPEDMANPQGEEFLEQIEDEVELDKVYEYFMENVLFDEEEEE